MSRAKVHILYVEEKYLWVPQNLSEQNTHYIWPNHSVQCPFFPQL